MKHFKHLCMLLAAMLLSINVWGETTTKTEGFETATTGTNYQSTVEVAATSSDCSIAWSIYYGNVTTSSKIAGSNSVGLRLYTSNYYGYLKTTTAIDNLSNVAFTAKAATSNGAAIKVNISYSTDGSSLTSIADDIAIGSTADSYDYDIPNGGKYFQIAISSNSTKPSKSNAQLTIDDVVFTYSEGGSEQPTV